MAVTQQAVAGMRQLRDNRDENAAPTGLDSLELVSVMTITPPARRRSYEAPAGSRGSGLGGYEVPSPEPWAVSLSLSRGERACHPERRRREGPAFRERRATAGPSLARVPRAPLRSAGVRQQVLRSPACRGHPSFRGRPPAGPSLARVLRGTLGSAVVRQQVLRSRVCRAAPFVPRSSSSRSFARARAARS